MSEESLFGLSPQRLNRVLSIVTQGAGGTPDANGERSPDQAGTPSTPPASLEMLIEKPGDWVGQYRLLSLIGEGGMGIVYLAEQEHPIKRHVALKVIKPGMDSRRVIARFEAERQTLALLDHPNIAHMIDAGTTETSRPYFVMEYVKGLPITHYCDEHRLSIEERLGLFIQVCHAVQYAHRKGIIHRDLKPSNILVVLQGDKPVPKIIDFGVAKAISQPLLEQTFFTEQGQLVGTPEYMSPEQADMANQDIDTRSDIYSLGVVLYVLIAGVRPFDFERLRDSGIEHIRRVIREEDPKTPSTRVSQLKEEDKKEVADRRGTEISALTRRLRRELEWIPLKAMRKNPVERYGSASDLAHDIENYLQGTPLIAGPPGVIYRMKKFVSRNRAQVVAMIVTAVMVAGMAAISLMYSDVAHRATKAESLEHQSILSRIMELNSKGQFQNALAAVAPILNSRHVGPEARLLHARLILAQGQPAQAIRELETLLHERDTIACPAHLLLARIYLEGNAGDPGTSAEYLQKAREHEQQGATLLSESADAYCLRAMTAGSLQEALTLLGKAIDLDQTHDASRKMRALTYYALRDYRNMELDAAVLMALRQWDSLGYLLMAVALRETEHPKEAIAYHDRAVALSPNDPELYDQRRQTYTVLSEYEKALSDAQECVRLRPDEKLYHFHVFGALVALDRHAEAKAEYVRIVGGSLAVRTQFNRWAAKETFDFLHAGRELNLPSGSSEEAAFWAMYRAADDYHELKSRAKRIIASAFSPAWSPGGTELSYSRGITGSSGLEIVNIASGRTRLLTMPGKDPAWSPDGRYIAYVRDRQTLMLSDLTAERVLRPDPFLQEELWVIRPDGAEPRKLGIGGTPSWDHLSKQVFFPSRTLIRLCSLCVDDPTAELRQFTSGHNPYAVVSPDDKYLVDCVGGDVRILEVTSGSIVSRWQGPPRERGVLSAWSRDGRHVCIAGFHDSDLGLWIYDIQAQTSMKLLNAPVTRVAWSPDGGRLAIGLANPYNEIWIAEVKPGKSLYETFGRGQTLKEHYQYLTERYVHAIGIGAFDSDDYIRVHRLMRNLRAQAMDAYDRGDYQESLVMFVCLDRLQSALGGPSPQAIASIVMSLHQLGREREAKDSLDRLRSLFADGHTNSSDEKYLTRAEALFVEDGGPLHQTWKALEGDELPTACSLARSLQASVNSQDLEMRAGARSAVTAVARACLNRGRDALQQRRAYGEAISDYETSLHLDPNCAGALHDLACLRAACPSIAQHDTVAAVEYASQACRRTDGRDHYYLGALAAVCAEKGDLSAAATWQRQALDSVPDAERPRWRADYESRLQSYESGRPYDRGNLWSFAAHDMIAWWDPKEIDGEIIIDSSGKGLAGRLIGNVQIVTDSQRGAVLRLGSGVNCVDCEWDLLRDLVGYVDCGDNSVFDLTKSITIAAWVKTARLPGYYASIIAKGDTAWRLLARGPQARLHFAVTGGPEVHGVTGQMDLSPNVWHHVCGTYDGSYLRLYMDGAQDPAGPVAYAGGIATNHEPVYIGAQSQGLGQRPWDGFIDDVRLYGRALSPDQVETLYKSGRRLAEGVSIQSRGRVPD